MVRLVYNIWSLYNSRSKNRGENVQNGWKEKRGKRKGQFFRKNEFTPGFVSKNISSQRTRHFRIPLERTTACSARTLELDGYFLFLEELKRLGCTNLERIERNFGSTAESFVKNTFSFLYFLFNHIDMLIYSLGTCCIETMGSVDVFLEFKIELYCIISSKIYFQMDAATIK